MSGPTARWETPRIDRREWIALAAVLLVALAARLAHLGACLWYDEILTVVDFVRLPVGRLVGTFDSLNNHMLYSLAAHASAALFGESAWSVRLPAVIFGVGSIAVQWLIARRVVGRGEALLVALLLAISYHHVWFSQNARGYTMLLFWTSGSMLAFLEGLVRPSRRVWTLFAICTAAAMYTHLSAAFFYAAVGLCYVLMLASQIWRQRDGGSPSGLVVPIAQPLYGVSLAIALTIVLHLPILRQAAQTVHGVSVATAASGTALAEWQSPLRTIREIGISIASAGLLAPVLVAGAVLTLIAGGIGLARRQPVLVAVYAVHIPLTILILHALSFRIWPRYFFTEIGFIYLLLVHGMVVLVRTACTHIAPLNRRPRSEPLLVGCGAIMMTAASALLLAHDYSAPKQDYVGARDFVQARLAPGDAVGATGLAAFAYDRYYRPGWRAANTPADLRQLEHGPGRAWILVAFPHQTTGARPEVMAQIAQRYDKVAVFPGTLGDGAIWVYRSR